jgi:molybdate transport system substrate-binding protein
VHVKAFLCPVIAALGLVLTGSGHGFAQGEITVLTPASIRPALEQLIPRFEQKTGNTVKVTFGNAGRNKQQVASGEATFDVAILQPPYPDVLASGNVVNDSATPFASIAIGVAVKQGAARPDLSTPDAVKRMLRSATSLTYPASAGGAAAGVSIEGTFQQLGIADEMKPKVRTGAGAIGLVATGEVQLYLTFLSEMTAPGIDVVGPLPREISTPTDLVGFVTTHAKNPGGARELLNYLFSSDAAPVYKAHWMVPNTR